MKTIEEVIKENKEEQIDEGLSDVLRTGVEIALLSGIIALFVKSVKDIAQGENGFIEIVKKLREDAKIARINKKLAKNQEALSAFTVATVDQYKEKLNNEKLHEILTKILSKSELEYLTNNIEEVINNQKQ